MQHLHGRAHFIAALSAELVTFLVKVFHIGAGSHYTAWNVTMQEPEHMAQFVGNDFPETIEKQGLILFHSIMLVSQPVERSNTCISVQRSLSENIGKYRDAQIHTE